MRNLISSAALMLLVAGAPAAAQTGNSAPAAATANSNGSAADRGAAGTAPVGHRQPRADQVPSEKSLGNPDDPANREDAALDRKIKSICRGC